MLGRPNDTHGESKHIHNSSKPGPCSAESATPVLGVTRPVVVGLLQCVCLLFDPPFIDHVPTVRDMCRTTNPEGISSTAATSILSAGKANLIFHETLPYNLSRLSRHLQRVAEACRQWKRLHESVVAVCFRRLATCQDLLRVLLIVGTAYCA